MKLGFLKKINYYILSGFIILIALNVFVLFSALKNKDDVEKNNNGKSSIANTVAIEIPDKADFAGEQVPLDRFDIREAFDKELVINVYYNSSTLFYFKKANRWFPIIEPILKRHNIPNDFKYLALIESGFNLNSSSAGASGYWQIMKETGKGNGLEINEEVDERYNVEKSTEMACRYLRDAYETYNSWTMAAAAYNMGKGNLNINIKNQKVSNYYELYLNDETARYVFRILAAKTILNNPEKYGYSYDKNDLYPSIPTNEVTVDSSIKSITDFAATYGLSYKMLRIFNPWLRKPFLNNKEKKTYIITIPDKNSLNYSILQKDNNSKK